MQTLEEQGYINQSIAKPFCGKPISKTFSNVPSPLHPKYIQTPKFQGKNKIIMLVDVKAAYPGPNLRLRCRRIQQSILPQPESENYKL